jgi:hypothetical protein
MTNPFQQSWLMTRVGGLCARFQVGSLPVKIRAALLDYSYLLGSAVARLALGGLYFAILVNCLSLAEYGVFASAVATALMIGNGGTFGFNAPLFRAAATRPRIVGTYVAALLVYALATIPFVLALTFLAHLLILGSFISLPSLIAIVLSEAFCARFVLTVQALHVGLGRYALASAIGILPQILRSAAVVAFWFFCMEGAGSLGEPLSRGEPPGAAHCPLVSSPKPAALADEDFHRQVAGIAGVRVCVPNAGAADGTR